MKAKKKVGRKKNTDRKKIFWSLAGVFFVLFLSAIFFFAQYISEGLPSLEELENPKPKLASTVFSSDGDLIGRFFRENRIETQIDSIPKFMVNALIATEDKKFYEHWGVDLDRFIKAVVKTIFFGELQGGSTITQQLAKNLYELRIRNESFSDKIIRKIREWITAIQIEKTYTKPEILEMYFNISYFGEGAYGIETAAKVYFNKSVSELTVPEGAVLIALLNSSVYYHPVKHYDNAFRRRNLVMFNMYESGFLSREDYEKYKREPIQVSMKSLGEGFISDKAPHFVEYVRQQLTQMSSKYDFDLYEDGLTIYTTIDMRMQDIAVKAVRQHLDAFQKKFDKFWNWNRNRKLLNELIDKAIKKRKEYRFAKTAAEKKDIYSRLKKNTAFVDSVQTEAQRLEVGFVVLDAKNGEIKAMVGGRNNNFNYGLNHVTQIRRQPGSAFKPIIYTCAIDNGLYPAYPILNQPFVFGEGRLAWSPQNFDKSTGGFTTLREGLRRSLNIIAARLIIEDHVKLPQVGRYAEKMGINSRLELLPAIALGGTSGVTPLELTSVYATIANHGIYNSPISITKLEDKDGIIIDNFSSTTREALSEETAYIITDMLKTVINSGTGRAARSKYNFYRPAGGKTGTTQGYADTWFMGFTPQLAAGVWVGFDDQRISFTGSYGTGSQAALPIWAVFMRDFYKEFEEDYPVEYFEPPASGNVVTAAFCNESIFELGDPKLYSDDCFSGIYRDIINVKDLPRPFNAEKDTSIKIFDKYLMPDTLAHEAIEIL
ncbi:MAG: PBP1A family penicillin-binding protein [Chlorobi bacterium]|nr:PBP1A family penicillin-binding protein [Chlorobiota bacterium]